MRGRSHLERSPNLIPYLTWMLPLAVSWQYLVWFFLALFAPIIRLKPTSVTANILKPCWTSFNPRARH